MNANSSQLFKAADYVEQAIPLLRKAYAAVEGDEVAYSVGKLLLESGKLEAFLRRASGEKNATS